MADKAGFLTKEGFQFKTWKVRWCVLKKNALYYSKKEGGGELGIIRLHGIGPDNISVSSKKKKKHCFEIQTPSRTYFLIAQDDKDMEEWIKALKESVERNSAMKQGKEKKKIGLEDFQLMRVIGKGAFGKVIQVKKKDTGKIYAMKVLNKKSILDNNELEHTKTEKNLLQRLIHPFLINLNYSFQTEEQIHFVMDFVSGGELFYHLQREQKFNEDRVKFYCAEILLGLEYLHNSGVIYRDLKPENILLTQEGHVCMTDFGISKEGLIAADARTATFCGTPEYLAPEVLEGKQYNKAVDWWSFGTLIHEMLVGLPPFYTQDVQEMYLKIMRAPLVLPDELSQEAKSIIGLLLERNPSKRLADAGAIKSHSFFKGIDWGKVLRKEYAAPFLPPVKSGEELFVDESFLSEDVAAVIKSDPQSKISENQQKNFAEFTYIPENDAQIKQ